MRDILQMSTLAKFWKRRINSMTYGGLGSPMVEFLKIVQFPGQPEVPGLTTCALKLQRFSATFSQGQD